MNNTTTSEEQNDQNNQNSTNPGSGILDTVSQAQQTEALQNFNARELVFSLLDNLAEREKQVLIKRYGLIVGRPVTLEKIGEEFNLTRERIRQIEKDAIKKLNKLTLPKELEQGIELIFQIIDKSGKIVSEDHLLEKFLTEEDPLGRPAAQFNLQLSPKFSLLKESNRYNRSWYIIGFEKDWLKTFLDELGDLLKSHNEPLTHNHFYKKVQNLPSENAKKVSSPEHLESLAKVSKKIGQNVFGHWGLIKWVEISPKDVGDKAYLVLNNYEKPEHYDSITELINKEKFDSRIAHKETVHNELIKDSRFVLIGRGIYALREWGYAKGTVADIIEQILRKADRPLTKQDIIDEVLKQRMVKKNTIIVSLSNKDKFKKIERNKYQLAEKQ